MNAAHLKFIQEGLLDYFFPINTLSEQKRAMWRVMHKPWDHPFNCFAARLTELNDYLPLFPGSSSVNKIPLEDLNDILLHAVPKGWAKQAYIQGWNFEMKSYKATWKLFKRMEVAEKIYKGENTYKTPPREDANCASHGRKRKGG